ncbi:uncharacterized protein BP01DRAFT_399477, partial [Aspergillus saccharolyticus JOP 1030-1]
MNAGVAYTYCTYNERHTVSDLVACLLRQSGLQLRFLPQEVSDLYESHCLQRTLSRKEALLQALVSIINLSPHVSIVTDALDECQDEQIRREFLDFLKVVGQRVNLLVTSRPHPTVEDSLRGALQEKIQAPAQDIEACVGKETASTKFVLSRQLPLVPQLRASTIEEIVSKNTPRFLHTRFHINHLAAEHNLRSLYKALRELPRTLGEIYKETMRRLKKQNAEAVRLAEKTLLWITYASRPLRIQEFQHALAVRKGNVNIDDKALTAPKYILSICVGLVTIDERSSICCLVHYTAYEFF